jgi:hypothetical protein
MTGILLPFRGGAVANRCNPASPSICYSMKRRNQKLLLFKQQAQYKKKPGLSRMRNFKRL